MDQGDPAGPGEESAIRAPHTSLTAPLSPVCSPLMPMAKISHIPSSAQQR